MILDKFKELFLERKFDKIYIIVDIHGTILIPTRDKNVENYKYYPYSLESLRIMSSIPWIVLIIWSSSYNDKLFEYNSRFKEDGICFNYINENPEIKNGDFSCFDKKIFCDIGIDDKFGFSPLEWENIYNFLIEFNN